MNSQDPQPMLSPFQMVDFPVIHSSNELKPLETKFLQSLLIKSHADTAIVITAGKIEPGQPAKVELAQINIGELDALTAIEKAIVALINMRENLYKNKQ